MPRLMHRWDTEMDGPAAPETWTAGYLISRNPLILWAPSSTQQPLGPAPLMFPGDRRVWTLISPSWNRERPGDVLEDLENIRRARSTHPEHRYVYLVASRRELENYRAAGVPAIVCMSNALVNETIFDIVPGATRRFDAIYNAAFAPYKRQELACRIESLALIHHRYEYFLKENREYVERSRALLAHATFLNEIDGKYRLFGASEVAAWLQQAHVGLCLSEAEGPMRACVEYLLCGLPVVSTPSIGGRDRLLDPAYAIICEAKPEAVAAAVMEMKRRKLDPELIRRSVCDKLKPDRIRMIQLIERIFAEETEQFPARADWIQLFRRGTWPIKTVDKLMNETAVAETIVPDSSALKSRA